MSTAANPVFDPDAFHQQYAQGGGAATSAFDPDTFHAQYSGGDKSQDAPSSPPSLLSRAGTAAKDVGIGAVKGLGNTVSGVSSLINKIPYVGETLAPKAGITAMHNLDEPTNTAQKVGKYGEQAAEFLIPGAGEEAAGAKAAELLPSIAKYATPAARVATGALDSGLINKLQGGSFASGAELGAGGGALGEAGRAIAPSVAESALGITRNQRGYGRTPGEAALKETTGLRPGTIENQARAKIGSLTRDMEGRAAASPSMSSTVPALDVIDKAQATALKRNSRATYDALQDVKDQLTKEFSTGAAIPQSVSPSRVIDLKRGVGDLLNSWSPEQRSGIKPTIRQVYRALDGELDKAVPEAEKLNQRISSLIPVEQRSDILERGAPLGQRVAHRMAAHTGALAGSAAGGALGYQRGGAEGAAIGAGLGLLGPEVVASPTGQMIGARMLASPRTFRVGRGLTSQILGRDSENDNPEDEDR